eukprot:1628897-Amphidinium_carterae.1
MACLLLKHSWRRAVNCIKLILRRSSELPHSPRKAKKQTKKPKPQAKPNAKKEAKKPQEDDVKRRIPAW